MLSVRSQCGDLRDAELHLLDTGHFATATHHEEIADLIAQFLHRKLGDRASAGHR